MKRLSFFSNLMLTRFSKPVEDRVIYRLIQQNQYESILEIGLGDGKRLEKMLQVAHTFSNSENLRYTGVDLFDARPNHPLKLIDMHRVTRGLPAKTQLVPGDLATAIRKIANSHLRTDLVIFSAGFESDQLTDVAEFLPRMLHSNSRLLIQHQPGGTFEVLNRLDVERMSTNDQGSRQQRAA